MDPKTTIGKNVFALTWNIATEPRLYLQLAPNPYSSNSFKIISERFQDINISDVIQAVIWAQPEGEYDKNFKQLPPDRQESEFFRETHETSEITKHLNEFFIQYKHALSLLPDDLVYELLFKTAFKTSNLLEVEHRYAQNQKIGVKLLISDLISQTISLRLKKKHSLVHNPRKTFSIAAFVLLSIISFSSLTFLILDKQSPVVNANSPIVPEQVLSSEVQKKSPALPVRLIIPSLNVDATVKGVGITEDGAMEVPNNTIDLGWYKLGSSPGEVGNAVIAGHFNGINGEPGVFKDLSKLKPGDKIYVVNDRALTTTFMVRESRTFKPGFADEVFSSKDTGIHLNLITCDGSWDEVKKSYTKRLVVFSDIL